MTDLLNTLFCRNVYLIECVKCGGVKPKTLHEVFCFFFAGQPNKEWLVFVVVCVDMFRWLYPSGKVGHPSAKNPGVWTDLKQHISHAFSPVFQYTPEHPVKDCHYCYERMRHRGDHVKDKVPLAYQTEAFTSHKITRYSMTLALSYKGQVGSAFLDQSPLYGVSWLEACQGDMGCKVNRTLMDQGDYIVPTKDNICEEMKHLLSHAKINNHVLIYLTGHASPDGQGFMTSDGEVLSSEEFMKILKGSTDKHVYVWLVVDTKNGAAMVRDLPYQYSYKASHQSIEVAKKRQFLRAGRESYPEVKTEEKTEEKTEVTTKVKLHCLTWRSLGSEAGSEGGVQPLTVPLLEVMRRQRYRMSVRRLLKDVHTEMARDQGGAQPIFLTNYPINTKKTYFGFG